MPLCTDPVPQFQTDSRVLREIANVVSSRPVLSDNPELVAH